MPKVVTFRKGLASVLFWSIISAAFIGPGTVTTCSNAGASFHLQLLWALVFSVIATIILQEAAARVTIASGKNLGEIIALRYAEGAYRRLRLFLFLAVALGCAAYEAGNLLGSLAGLQFFVDFPRHWMTLVLGVVAGGLLWLGNFRTLANMLGLMVGLMGVVFVVVTFQTPFSLPDFIAGSFIPRVPAGAGLLVIGLIGTTIVPYNLFLASGISQGQEIHEMRLGIALAVLIGGIISIAILVVGITVTGPYSYEALAESLADRLGNWAIIFFGVGLFAAGFSSAITAPLAAAVTARSLFGGDDPRWAVHSTNFRLVWGVVLATGLAFGLLEIQPIPVIILAQAVNGVLLPVVSTFLLLAMNDRRLLPAAYVNSRLTNILMLFIVGVTCFLGLNNIWSAIGKLYVGLKDWPFAWLVNLSLALLLIIVLIRKIFTSHSVSST